MKVELVLPSWIATLCGLLVITALALGAVSVVQARIIDQQAIHLLELSAKIEALTDRIQGLEKVKHELTELQEWRVSVTIASRSGWKSANQYILDNPLPMPDGMTESSRPEAYR